MSTHHHAQYAQYEQRTQLDTFDKLNTFDKWNQTTFAAQTAGGWRG
ncbi:hypothetical protein [Streptacidiphilus sp. MAP5-3]